MSDINTMSTNLTEGQNPHKTVYHYCGIAAFKSIIETRSLWLTDLYQTNDKKEGRETSEVIAEILRDLGVKDYRIEEWKRRFDQSIDYFQAFGFCSSEEGDLLSQWRGYSDDGSGFAIGFRGDGLHNAARDWNSSIGNPILIFERVKYDRLEQRNTLQEIAQSIKQAIDDGALDHNRRLGLLSIPPTDEEKQKQEAAWSRLIQAEVLLAVSKRYEMKHHSFREEKEWRLFAIRTSDRKSADGTSKDYLGFRAKNNSLASYFKFEFDHAKMIERIIVGPKNKTPDYVLSEFLRVNALDHVPVQRSISTYW